MNSAVSKYVSILCLLMMVVPLKSFSQESSDVKRSITKTINNYFEGYVERDSTKLYSAFDTENGTMKVPMVKDEIIVGYENRFFKDLMPIWSNRDKLSKEDLKNCELQILGIDIESDQIASAKISMKVVDVTYIDIISLQLIHGNWKITNKIYLVKD
ncbi:MAG: nuclear transport factor 2 family protein [Psychroserpens sp.]|nr:nuclear transport factor 2 family protein [Psychroserpens sp.]